MQPSKSRFSIKETKKTKMDDVREIFMARIINKNPNDSKLDETKVQCSGFTTITQAKAWMFDMGYSKAPNQDPYERFGLRGQVFSDNTKCYDVLLKDG